MDNVKMVVAKAKKVMGIRFLRYNHVDYSKHPSLKGVSPFLSEETVLVVGS